LDDTLKLMEREAPAISPRLRALAQDFLGDLREMSFDGVGVSRETCGPGETAAMQALEHLATREGLETRWDAACNLIVRLPGLDPSLPVVASR
jgi:N-carbamoyl-L-amino-acid hydrolase